MNKYTRYSISIGCICAALSLGGCIKNDIPYPHIPAQILSIEAAGLAQTPTINNDTRTVSLVFADTVDLQKVTITGVQMTEKAQVSPSIIGVHDLTSPQEFVLSIYQDYTWTISASQNIEREFTVKNQVGNALIEAVNKRARVFVSEYTDLEQIEITNLVLGPQGLTTYSPTPEELHDFSDGPRTVTVKYHSITEEWTLYVVHTTSNVSLTSVDAWTCVAWLYGSGLEQNDNRFEIKEAGTDTWTEVPEEYMISQGSSFAARVPHLKPNTEYVARAFIIGEKSNEITFTTGPEVELPNGNFNEWWLNGKIWQPWAEGGTPWWDTGNHGSATLNVNVTTQDTDIKNSGTSSIKMASQFVSLFGTIGKFAAGNVFAGSYVGTDGTNGILDFGRPISSRPSQLKGYYKYIAGEVDYSETDELPVGATDKGNIYIAIGDWTAPVRITTKDKNIFNKDDEHIIGFGEIVPDANTPGDGLIPFTIDIDYRSYDRIPTYIVIVASASYYGDFFTGSSSSTLWLDDLELVYE